MKIFRLLLLICLPLLFHGTANSQNVKENELVVIDGQKFIMHQVRTGETIYSISRDFKIEPKKLMQYNISTSDGLDIGEILKVPFNEEVDLTQLPNYNKGKPTSFTEYIVESNGETAYSISKKYGITVEELYSSNPDLNRLKKGMQVKIPKWDLAETKSVKPEKQIESETAPELKIGMVEHTVVSGETLYSLCKKYRVSENEMIKYNPEVMNLKAGSKIYLPAKTGENEPSIKVVSELSSGNKMHTIVSGETLWSLAYKYDIADNELFDLNPQLKSGVKAGMVIKIPSGSVSKPKQNGSNNLSGSEGNMVAGCGTEGSNYSENACVVALFLPLYIDTNNNLNLSSSGSTLSETEKNGLTTNADTVIENEPSLITLHKFHGNSENFLQFYEGALIAVDSMQRLGMKVKLQVFDTKESPEVVTKILRSSSFEKPDLIIGPVYENIQKEVARYAEENQVPVVSPFTPKSGIISANPMFYQINPTREYLAEATAEMVAQNYDTSNFIIVKTSSYEGTADGQLVALIKQKLTASGNYSFKVYDFKKERASGLKHVLVANKENVIFIPTSDEGELSVAISNINNLAGEYSITLIGSGNYQQRFSSIEVSHFHNLKMQYINPYWVDYKNISTTKYIEKFITYFGTEPNSYGMQGFDASFYFLRAMQNYGTNFSRCLPNMKVNLVQGNYAFQNVSEGAGFMNSGVSVISYNPNFEVECKKVMK